MSESIFSVSVDSHQVALAPLSELERANAADDQVVEWLRGALEGEICRFGGGAAPVVSIKRVS